jgi:hypothetical protein
VQDSIEKPCANVRIRDARFGITGRTSKRKRETMAMIPAQIELILNEYRRELDRRMAVHQHADRRHEQLLHVRQMIPKTIQFLYDQRIEKAMRWLGFIQGALWSHNIYTIEEMKNHNKPIGKK